MPPAQPSVPPEATVPVPLTSAQVPAQQGLGEDHLSAAQHAAPASVRGGASPPCHGEQRADGPLSVPTGDDCNTLGQLHTEMSAPSW